MPFALLVLRSFVPILSLEALTSDGTTHSLLVPKMGEPGVCCFRECNTPNTSLPIVQCSFKLSFMQHRQNGRRNRLVSCVCWYLAPITAHNAIVTLLAADPASAEKV